MRSVPDDVFAFRLWRRASDREEWLTAPRLLVRVGDGGSEGPAHLCWVTEAGTQTTVGFSPDMASCYGHRRTADGEVVEVRGELDGRWAHPWGAEDAHGYEFDTEVQDAGNRRPAGRLRVLIDDGGEAPVREVTWVDGSGDTCSIALRPALPSGAADVSGLVSGVRASAEHRAAGEVAANLVDASTRKWFAPHDRAFLEFRLTRPVVVDRYVLTSADDAPDRDPAAWILRGSADGRLWQPLDVRSGQSFAERHQSRTYRIADPEPYDRYRLDITGNNGSPHLQLASVRFLADSSGAFVGHRRRAGHAPVAYRGTRVRYAAPTVPVRLPMAVEAYDSMDPLVIRTDFTDDAAWGRVVEELRAPWLDSESVEPRLISDPAYTDASVERVLDDVRTALPGPRLPGAVFIADSTTMHGTNHPLLAVSTAGHGESSVRDEAGEGDFVTRFRLAPDAAMEITTNLALGNMRFEDFARDGLYKRMV